MANPLLDRATPQGLARVSQVIDCKVELKQFARLSAAVAAELAGLADAQKPAAWQQAPVGIRLRFGYADAEGRVPTVVGDARTTVAAVCQRCLEVFELSLATELAYLLAEPDAAVPELSGYEVWELGEASFRPADLVDEALLMAWPLAAAHALPADCGPLADKLGAEASEMVRPFADLRARLEGSDRNK